MVRTRQTKVSDLFSLGKRKRESMETKGKKMDADSPKRKKKKLNYDEDDETFSPIESSEEETYSPENIDVDEEPLVDTVMSSPERSPSPVRYITKITNIEYNIFYIAPKEERKNTCKKERKNIISKISN